MHFAKPRIECYSREILEQLLRILHESSKDSFHCPALRQSAAEAFLFLVEISPLKFLSLCKGLDNVTINPTFDELIQQGFTIARASVEGQKCDSLLSEKMENLTKEAARISMA
jgi:hypothetical protein